MWAGDGEQVKGGKRVIYHWRVVNHATYFPPALGRGAASSVTSTFTELPSSIVLKKYLNCPFLPKAALNSASVGPYGPLQEEDSGLPQGYGHWELLWCVRPTYQCGTVMR